MFQNYLKIALRNIIKQKIHSFINVFGLALGLMCCIIISQFVISEIGYDTYHQNGDRLYRVSTISEMLSTGEKWKNAFSSILWGPAMQKDFPEVENFTRIVKSWESLPVELKNHQILQDNVYYAENSLFELFNWNLIAGDARTVFDHPYNIVLTEKTAQKYFGDENPLGKNLMLVFQQRNEHGQTYEQKTQATISGIMTDVPLKTHIKPEVLISFITLNDFYGGDVNAGSHPDKHFWRRTIGYTYLCLHEGNSPGALKKKFVQFLDKYIGDANIKRGFKYHLYLQNMPDIHLEKDIYSTPEPGGNKDQLVIFSIISFFVLLIACFNFMNLSTAHSASRSIEVGIRKVVGSSRKDLIAQFLCESIIISLMAAGLGFVLSELIKPIFSYYSGKNISLLPQEILPYMFGLMGITLLVGILAGSYPAFFLSAFRPIAVLKNTFQSNIKGAAIKKGLLILQFAITIIFIIATITANEQIGYMKTQDLGFNSSQILVIPPASDYPSMAKMDAFRNELLKNPNIKNFTISNDVPGRIYSQDLWAEFGKQDKGIMPLYEIVTDCDFIDTYGLKVIAGRNFSKEIATDARSNFSNIIPVAKGLMSNTTEEIDGPRKPLEIAVILNEEAVRRLNFSSPEDALGKIFVRDPVSVDFTGKVVGVVNDFHFHSLQTAIEPMVLYIHDQSTPTSMAISLQISDQNVTETISFIGKLWSQHFPASPYDYFFIDREFQKYYEQEQRILEIFSYTTLFTIFIACLGLFGLILFVAAQKTKEIGIRKILGATVANIVVLLSKDFVKLVLISNIIAWPVAYVVMNKWLQNFAHRITIGWWIFILAGMVALVIALLTVGFLSIRAAQANPVESLRYE